MCEIDPNDDGKPYPRSEDFSERVDEYVDKSTNSIKPEGRYKCVEALRACATAENLDIFQQNLRFIHDITMTAVLLDKLSPEATNVQSLRNAIPQGWLWEVQLSSMEKRFYIMTIFYGVNTPEIFNSIRTALYGPMITFARRMMAYRRPGSYF